MTRALGQLNSGDLVGVRGPYGSSWPVGASADADVVVVAGGIGLAPLRPAIYQLLAERHRFGNICIYYGARTPEEILFAKQLERWRGRFDLKVEVAVDRATPGWAGRVGVVTRLLQAHHFDPDHSVALVCGPEVMIRHSVMTLNRFGVANERIHVSMERNMKCGVGLCGHCQYGPELVCRDGPVFSFDRIEHLFGLREI